MGHANHRWIATCEGRRLRGVRHEGICWNRAEGSRGCRSAPGGSTPYGATVDEGGAGSDSEEDCGGAGEGGQGGPGEEGCTGAGEEASSGRQGGCRQAGAREARG